MTDSIKFTIPGKPQTKQRARHGKGFTYTPKETVANEKMVKMIAFEAMQGKTPFQGGIRLQIDSYHAIPSSVSKKKIPDALRGFFKPLTKPDLDNIIKQVSDACNGVVYKDDNQIYSINAMKYFSETPRIQVVIFHNPEVSIK